MPPHGRSTKKNKQSQDIKLMLWRTYQKISVVHTHQTKSNFFFATFPATEEEQAQIKIGIEQHFPNMKVHYETDWTENVGRFCRLHIEDTAAEGI